MIEKTRTFRGILGIGFKVFVPELYITPTRDTWVTMYTNFPEIVLLWMA